MVPSTSSGHSTCVTAVTQTTDSLGPSHPNLPFITDVGGIYASSLPVGAGLQYALALTVGGLLPARIVASAFSDQLAGGVYSLCDQYSAALPILYGTVASYLTDTLTKYESGGTLGTVSAPVSSVYELLFRLLQRFSNILRTRVLETELSYRHHHLKLRHQHSRLLQHYLQLV